MIDEYIIERLVEIIGNNELSDVQQFAKDNGAKQDEAKDAESIARWLYGVDAGVKFDFLDTFNEEDCPPLRICTNCGDFMYEGYLLDYQYACSDECAIALYDGDEAALREDIHRSVDLDDGSDFFWTQWD